MKSKVTIGILAHVDAGKTTLSEGLLYETGAIRTLGSIDQKNTVMDTDEMEKQRGITIYSRTSRFSYGDREYILLDTPGHADFTAEMERVLPVLDYGILLISGIDGVQSHTRTLWELFEKYQIPCFLFVNKMDIGFADEVAVTKDIREKLSSSCIDFTTLPFSEERKEEIALCDETLLEQLLATGEIAEEGISEAIRKRKLYPVILGSALKRTGLDALLRALQHFAIERKFDASAAFGARCFKVEYEGNERISYLRIFRGSLSVKDVIAEEKIHQIRIYRGARYETVAYAEAGEICAVSGLSHVLPGENIGSCELPEYDLIEPVLSYEVVPPQDTSKQTLLSYLNQLGEEDPTLHVQWDDQNAQIHVHLMGPVQMEVLQQRLKQKFGILVTFGSGNVRYKETIEGVVEGVGHFEPLRHYAEAHIRIEGLPSGSGIEYAIDCPPDVLDLNWQRLIETHLKERVHKGVLTGSPLTDVRFTVVAGAAHKKHTVGGDFRQATYRAVRQGLRKSKNVLLEPFYQVRIELPKSAVGRAMTDLTAMGGEVEPPEEKETYVLLCGSAPVSLMRDYGATLASYTSGEGRMSLSYLGYFPCHNSEEVIAEIGYDPDADVKHTSDSVFCRQGVGQIVPWYEVEDYMHVPLATRKGQRASEDATDEEIIARAKANAEALRHPKEEYDGYGGLGKELEEIFVREFGEIKRRLPSEDPSIRSYDKEQNIRQAREEYQRTHEIKQKKPKKYLLVDGYNVIFSWKELSEIAKDSLEGARGRLLDLMCNYRGYIDAELIVVFDAYNVRGHREEIFSYQNIYVVYTKEAQTADAYIERTCHEIAGECDVTVATSDGMEQLIVLGRGAHRISSREFEIEVNRRNADALSHYIASDRDS